MNSDEVNSIADTLESSQVAQVVKDTFFEIIGSRDWPHLNQLIQLTPQGTSFPTYMDTGSEWNTVEWIKYNKRASSDTYDKFSEVEYLEPKAFTELLDARKSSDSNVVTTTDPSGVKLYILNDVAPTYWTTFDDDTLVFDSYDSGVDTNLQQSKFQCWGNVTPTWTHTDAAIPNLPSKVFPYLVSESKSTAFNSIKQAANKKEEQKSRRQRTHLTREKWRTNGGMRFPDYGRK